jgi:hypothetical protein
MNRTLSALATLVLLGAAVHSQAASTTQLAVNGKIIPAACTPLLSSNGLIDYGKLSQQDLNPDKNTPLAPQTMQVSVSCDAPTRFALRMADNRDGTANVNSEIYYGLGLDHSGNRIGLYYMSFDPRQSLANEQPVYGTESTTGGLAWRTANSNPIDIGANSYLGFTDIQGSTAGPMAIERLISQVTIRTVIAAKMNLDLSRDVLLDGSATLEVVYL